MRRVPSFLVALLCLASSLALSQEKGRVYDSVTSFLEALTLENVDSIIVDVDRLIASSGDSATQALVAGMAFDYFSSSPVMGQEKVAVHVADNYFLNKKLPWSDPSTYPLLYTYAESNRRSLVGCRAPSFEMETIDGGRFSLEDSPGRYKVLFFYDDHCAACKRLSPQLAEFARSYHGDPLTIIAVYTQNSRQEWTAYVSSVFAGIDNPDVSVVHLWDPESVTGYHMLYGVITTPALFLMDEQDIIIGRRLDCDALKQMMGLENSSSSGYRALFESIFSSLSPVDSASVADVAATLYRKCEADSALFREVFYELYDFLKSSSDYRLQMSAVDVARHYVTGMPERWSSSYVASVREALAMFALNPLGSRATDLVLRDSRGRERRLLSPGGRYTLVLFHLVRCADCLKEIDALAASYGELRRRGVKVICVYTGGDVALWKEFVANHNRKWLYLYDENGSSHSLYDIGTVPKVYLLDRKKNIIAKDIDINTITGLEL